MSSGNGNGVALPSADELRAMIIARSMGPKSSTVDGQAVSMHSIDELLKLLDRINMEEAAKKGHCCQIAKMYCRFNPR